MSADAGAPAAARVRALAISSGGGHWVQLLRVLPALADCDLALASVREAYRHDAGPRRFYVVRDATRWNPFGVAALVFDVLRVMLRERPQLVISTGAAPGCLAIALGRLLGARTIWLDSMANVERLSLSGRLVRPFCGLWLTQWPQLAKPRGPEFAGRVL